MDRYPEEFAAVLSAGLACALVLTWSVISLAYANNRNVAHMNDSFARRLLIESELQDLMSSVDHSNRPQGAPRGALARQTRSAPTAD